MILDLVLVQLYVAKKTKNRLTSTKPSRAGRDAEATGGVERRGKLGYSEARYIKKIEWKLLESRGNQTT